MNLLEQKYELLNQMYDITKEAFDFLSDTSFEDYNKINEAYSKRKELIKAIDILDGKMAQEGIGLQYNPEMKSNMEIVLSGISTLDEQVDEVVQKKFAELSGGLKEINVGRKGIDMTRYSDVQGLSFDISQ